jgi:DNA-binding CsgD family transcriptional regulator
MAVPGHQRRVAEQVAECCARAGDHRALRLEVLDLLTEAVPYDAYAWLLTDPETAVGGSPIADVPCLPRLPELIRLKYLSEVNRWTTMTGVVSRLRDATDGDLSRSKLWAELLVEYDVVDVVSVVFADAHGWWGFLDLWRVGQRSEFTAQEEEVLVTIAGIVTPALRGLQAASFVTTPGRPTQTAVGHQVGPVVLLLSPDLAVLSQTAETEAYLRTIVPTEEGRRPVPATAYNVGAQLLAVEAGVDDHPPLTRLHLADGQWVSMSAARLGATGPVRDRTIAVTLQNTTPADRMALFARASGLTPRETELVRHLGQGTDTRHLARQLGVSEHTVQDHLKAIFAKTSTSSRLQLVTRAFGS